MLVAILGATPFFVEGIWTKHEDVLFVSWNPSVIAITEEKVFVSGVGLKLLGYNLLAVVPEDKLVGTFSYFGTDTSISSMPTYAKVRLVYSDVEMVIMGLEGSKFEYQLFLRPNAPKRIAILFEGANLKLEDGRILVFKEGGVSFHIDKPRAFSGAREFTVETRIIPTDEGYLLEYSVLDWDGKGTLVIDPVITAVLSGDGFMGEFVEGSFLNGNSLYFVGRIDDAFHMPSPSFWYGYGSLEEAFISRFDANTNTHLSTAILGSMGNETAVALTVDAYGAIIVVGYTDDPNTFGPFRTTMGTLGATDVFIARLSPSLGTLLAITIMGGSSYDLPADVEVGTNGEVYVVGGTGDYTTLPDPKLVAGNPSNPPYADGFVARFSGDLSTLGSILVLATPSVDFVHAVEVDANGTVYVAGGTQAGGFETDTLANAGGTEDAFVAQLSANLNAILKAVVFGGLDNEAFRSMEIVGNYIYLCGLTWEPLANAFPYTRIIGPNSISNGFDVFVSIFNTSLTSNLQTAVILGNGRDECLDITVADSGYVYVSGRIRDTLFSSSRTVWGEPIIWNVSFEGFVTRLFPGTLGHLATIVLASHGYGDKVVGVEYNPSSGKVIIVGQVNDHTTFMQVDDTIGAPGGTMDIFVGLWQRDLSMPDKVVLFSGSDRDEAWSVTTDPDGNVVVAGRTHTSAFLGTTNSFGLGNGYEVFVSKFSPNLSTHIATAVVQGTKVQIAYDVETDSAGNIFIAGETGDTNYAPSRVIWGNVSPYPSGFVTKLSSDLSSHLGTVILTSNGADYAFDLELDNMGNVYVAGISGHVTTFSQSINRYVFGPPTISLSDAFVVKMGNDLSYIATAVIGGSLRDGALGIGLDDSGNVYISGYTSSGDYPRNFVYGPTGGIDAFVTKLSSDLSSHIVTAIIASDSNDYAMDVDVGPLGVYVAGFTYHPEWFAQPNLNAYTCPLPGPSDGLSDGFLAFISSSLDTFRSAFLLHTYDGFTGKYDFLYDVDVKDGKVYVAGVAGTYPSPLGCPSTVSGNVSITNQKPLAVALVIDEDMSTIPLPTMHFFGGSYRSFAFGIHPIGLDTFYLAGRTEKPHDFSENRIFYGDKAWDDAFVILKTPTVTGFNEAVSYKPYRILSKKGALLIRFELENSVYVGYDVYALDGRLVFSESLGVLSRGTYERKVKLPSGIYILRIRMGDKLENTKALVR